MIPWTTDQDIYENVLDDNPQLLGFFSDGDSWFAYPSYMEKSIISDLANTNYQKAYWLRWEKNGERIDDMMNGAFAPELRDLIADEDVHMNAILVSGGGNDIVLNGFDSLLNTYQPGMTALDCINQASWNARLGSIKDAYAQLIALRDSHRPEVPIFTHAYDFAIPTGKPIHFLFWKIGAWIKPGEVKKGITDLVLQQQINTYMLTAFANMQADLESEHKDIVYIRTQGALDPDTDWANEIHPTGAGFEKMAAKFQAALRSVFPELPTS